MEMRLLKTTTPTTCTTEAELEAKVREYLKSQGWLVFKFVSPGTAGVPDRIIIRDGRVVFLELKTSRGRLSKIQEQIKNQIQQHGGEYHVIRGKSDAVRVSEGGNAAH